jgi:hypothetical protein
MPTASENTTLMEVVNLVARSVGHPQSPDVAGSADEAIQRLSYYTNIACQELVTMANWEFLNQTGSLSIISDFSGQQEKAFDLPTDFGVMLDDTQWNRSTQLPAIGPVNPQDWQWLVVRSAKITTRFLWRIRNKQLWIKSPPDTAQDFSFEYLTKYWGYKEDNTTPTDFLTANGDFHIFPWQVVIMYTRAKWMENEGYDSTGAYNDFQKCLNYYAGTDKGASALSLVPGFGYPYLNAVNNLPDTGYGSV